MKRYIMLLGAFGTIAAIALAAPPNCPAQAPLGAQQAVTRLEHTTGDLVSTASTAANKTTAIGDYMAGTGGPPSRAGSGKAHEEFYKAVTDPCENPGNCKWSVKYYWKAKATTCVSTAEVPGEFDCAKSATGQGNVQVVGGSIVSSVAIAVCEGTDGDDNSGQYSTGPTKTETVQVGQHVWCLVASWSAFDVDTAGKGTAHHEYADPVLTVVQNTLVSGTCGESSE